MFRWYASAPESPACSWVFKCDDDTYVPSVAALLRYVAQLRPPMLAGWVWTGGGTFRDPKHKSYMPVETYPYAYYPAYTSGGSGYLVSWDLVQVLAVCELYDTANMVREDVTTGLCLRRYGVQPRPNWNMFPNPLKGCGKASHLVLHYMKAPRALKCWRTHHGGAGSGSPAGGART